MLSISDANPCGSVKLWPALLGAGPVGAVLTADSQVKTILLSSNVQQ